MEEFDQILVTVNTTHDDKDYDLWWELEILQGNQPLGKVSAGNDGNSRYPRATWPNDDRRDIVIPLDKTYLYSDRLKLSLRISQHTYSKNYGWEGNVEAVAHLVGGQIAPVLSNTSDFKLGEKGNPLTREFPFNL